MTDFQFHLFEFSRGMGGTYGFSICSIETLDNDRALIGFWKNESQVWLSLFWVNVLEGV